MPVGVMAETMTALEETHWIARCREKPLWPQRLEAHLAQVAMLLQHANVTKRSDMKPLSDFLLFRDKPQDRGDTPKQIRANFERIIARQKK